MRQDLGDAGFAQHVTEDLAAPGRYLVPVRVVRVSLVEIGFFEAGNRGERLLLGVARETPGADRRTDQVNRSAQSRHDRLGNDPVELAQDEPLRAAGRAGHRPHHLGREAVLLDRLQCARAGPETQSWPTYHPNGCRLTIVCSRSGPVEMMSIGIPASSSMRCR